MHQNGHAYLTSHRVCYVDNDEPRKHSVAVDLKEVDRYEFYVCHMRRLRLLSLTLKQAGFLRSSPKITLVPKPLKRSTIHNRSISALSTPSRSTTASPLSRTESPAIEPAKNITWVCPICTFSNPVPSNFDPTTATAHTPLPPCLACGIKPPLAHILKAAIAGVTNHASAASNSLRTPIPIRGSSQSVLSESTNNGSSFSSSVLNDGSALSPATSTFQCPRCTFKNHPSLLQCELCGASLISQAPIELNHPARSESPGPMLNSLPPPGMENLESIKLSFRGGGEKIFHERLKGSMTQRKWLLQGAPPVPKPNRAGDAEQGSLPSSPGHRVKAVGVAGLEQRGLDMRKNNELVIGNAFEDLEALMASAKEIVALAESFAKTNPTSGSGSLEANDLFAQSASALGLVTTKDMLGGGGGSETLYLSELSRNLAEFLTDDARGVLRKSGGIISLVDLWAMFNRARGGVELVSPADFEKAARLWEKLRLPIRLRQFKSGLLVAQSHDRTDQATIRTLILWLQERHTVPPEYEVAWDWEAFGRGVTAQETAERFGWSIGVAAEELEMAEEKGALCREEGVEGLRFWENRYMIEFEVPSREAAAVQ